MFVYLDNSATTRQYDRVTAYMKESMDDFYGNPSSLHSFGLDSEKKVRQARKNIAESLGCGYLWRCAQQKEKRKEDHHLKSGASGRFGGV